MTHLCFLFNIILSIMIGGETKRSFGKVLEISTKIVRSALKPSLRKIINKKTPSELKVSKFENGILKESKILKQ